MRAVARDLCSQPCRSFQLADHGLLTVCVESAASLRAFLARLSLACLCLLSAGFFCAAAATRIILHTVIVRGPLRSASVSSLSFLAFSDHGAQSPEDGVSSQRGGASPAAGGRSQSRRADAVQVRRETLPRPLLRQQAQLVRDK